MTIIIIYQIHILIILGISYYLFRSSSKLKPFFLPALFIKLISGAGIGVLYSNYYSFGDTWAYFHEANKLVDIAYTDFDNYFNYLFTSSSDIHTSIFIKQPRALFFTKVVSVLSFFTGKSYWLISCYLSLASFSALWILSKKLDELFPFNKMAIGFSLLFLPSVVFWTSGLIKESLSICFASILIIQYLKWSHNKRFSIMSVLVFTLSVLVLWKIKYYYAAVLISILIATLITQFTSESLRISKYGKAGVIAVYSALLIVSFLIIGLIKPNISFYNILHPIVVNNHAFVENSSHGDYIKYDNLHESFASILINTPKAIFSGLFRPFIWETHGSILKLIYSLENLIILILVMFRFIKIPNKISNMDFIYVISISSFTIVMITFLALSTPNYGTLVRYKSMVLPFLTLLLTINQPYFQKLNGLSIWKGRVKE